MGCSTINPQQITYDKKSNTPIGRLKITIVNATIYHKVSCFKMDPYLILRASNQSFTSKVIQGGDKQPSFFQSFQFIINSCYRINGRNLQITLLDKKKLGSDAEIGYGIIDLDPVINNKIVKDQSKCYLNFNRQKAALINIVSEFFQENVKILNMRFDSASIRRKTSTLSNMNCWVQVTMGQQVLKTSKQKDTKQQAPSWSKQILSFCATPSTPQVLIVIRDNQTEVGRFKMETSKMLAKEQQQIFNQQFLFDQTVNAGSLKFMTLVGINPQFSAPRISVAITEHKKDQKKQSSAKKQEPKKQEPAK